MKGNQKQLEKEMEGIIASGNTYREEFKKLKIDILEELKKIEEPEEFENYKLL